MKSQIITSISATIAEYHHANEAETVYCAAIYKLTTTIHILYLVRTRATRAEPLPVGNKRI